jgi:hypothetical protein
MADDMDVESVQPAQFSPEFEAIKLKGSQVGAPMYQCVVKTGAAAAGLAGVPDATIDLACLNPLRTDKDFLPEAIYLRQEMKEMFVKLLRLHEAGEEQRVLVGSPGVGKSVLFFLVALRRVVAHGQKVLYLRKTAKARSFSLFLIEKGADDDAVNVLFNRSLATKLHYNPHSLCRNLLGLTIVQFYAMVDGPKHNASMGDILSGGYDALCTSAGYPARKQEDIEKITVEVLSGWTEVSIKAAVKAMNGECTDERADDIYKLCGGRIRLAFLDEKKVKDWYDEVVGAAGKERIKLAITSEGATGEVTNSDRLRTRFHDQITKSNRMIVDSEYCFGKLSDRLESTDLIESYNLALALQLQAARGWFYEEIIHRWFQTPVVPQVEFMKGVGTNADGVRQLLEKIQLVGNTFIYWAPSKPNFANIDAAILIGRTLICFQYTVQSTHTFVRDTLYENIVGVLLIAGIAIERVQVVFVTPKDANFSYSEHSNFAKQYSVTKQTATRSTQLLQLQFTFQSAVVEANSDVSLNTGITSFILPILRAAQLAAAVNQNMAGNC